MPEVSDYNRADYLARARRFPIQAEVSFRERGETAWHEGRSVNISRTGILFRTDRELNPKTHLEIDVLFPAKLPGSFPVNVMFWGMVVRNEPSSGIEGPPAKAATILRYQFCKH